ncbi:MAG: chromate efflux transporter [Acidobacteria bacterium]|nr:chromate efflux transporter [Acidobacteriota bacterium]
MENKNPWDISKTFFKIGLTCWGGPAIVAQIKKEVVDKKNWVSEEEFKETLGFCQMFPGPIAVQTSAHLGYRLGGIVGSISAFVSYILPTFAFMLIFSFLYCKYEKVPEFVKLFKYLDAVIVAIIIDAIWSMRKITEQNFKALILVILCASAFLLNYPVVFVLLLAGLFGILFFDRKEDKGQTKTKIFLKSLIKMEIFPVSFLVLLFAFLLFLLKSAPNLGELGLRMAKINLLSFGGGYTAVALMFRESVLLTNWLTEKEFINGLALGQITPGPVIITATFIGYKISGLWGAFLSTIAVLFPSYLLILVLAPFFREISSIRFLKSFTSGLLCAFLGMLFQLLVHISLVGLESILSLILTSICIVLLRFKISPVYLVIISIIVSHFF